MFFSGLLLFPCFLFSLPVVPNSAKVNIGRTEVGEPGVCLAVDEVLSLRLGSVTQRAAKNTLSFGKLSLSSFLWHFNVLTFVFKLITMMCLPSGCNLGWAGVSGKERGASS